MAKFCKTLAIVFVVLFAGGLSGREKPDFSGKWILNKQKSKLNIKRIESGVISLDHQEPNFHFHRLFIIAGNEYSYLYDLTTDGREKITEEDGETLHSRLYWEEDSLILDVHIISKRGEATNKVKYTLTDEGKTLVAEEQFRGPRLSYDNLWVLDKEH
ncbi:MAG: hypothetical protein JXB26_13155 [Candidatus Aminicenantes bacterium]|nr:hypothetical protein [Candidatus Aminicenantes bacterium]